jgi:hypothetical protein
MQMLLPFSRILGSFTLPSAGSLECISLHSHTRCVLTRGVHLGHVLEDHVCSVISTELVGGINYLLT